VDGCSHPSLPTLFSRVSRYSTWVSAHAPVTDWVDHGSTSDTSATIAALVPGYRYDVRVRAVNDVGAGGWSNVATGLVAGSVPPPVEP
jgi:predicted phage tail protein